MSVSPAGAPSSAEAAYVREDWDRFLSLTSLVDHWRRTGWTPGRRSFHWFLALDHCSELVAITAYCHKRLRRVPTLDLVPTDTLHVTVQRIAFAGEITLAELGVVADATRQRCVVMSELDLTIGPLSGSSGAVRFSVGPHEPVSRVRAVTREVIRDILGAGALAADDTTFTPHVSIAYNNNPAPARRS